MEETVETALGAAFPGRVIDRTFGVGPSWNGANETVGVVFADGSRVFCKVAVAGDGSRIAREIAVLRYLDAGRPISGPEVLAGDPDASVPYLVTAPAPGRELLGVWEEAEEAQREALLRRVGATLATLHAERFETHGEIVGGSDEGEIGSRSGSALILDPAPWPDVLRATIERTREIGTSERLADHYDAVFDCVEANRDRLGGAPAALLHGDVAKPNLFVTDDGGVGVDAESRTDTGPDGITPIDWELAHVGDPARDLVRAEDQLLNGFDSSGPERYAEALYKGYRERAGGLPPGFAERRPVYEVVRMLGRSGFIDQWATYLDEPIDRLVDRANAELRARLDAV
ncbi:phosphotransferase family protein [Halorubrum lacusprofundi]|jgi:aminoglycoside phosphotransferase (APT) family kinase protein|uniref:Aminoglycoside phosphotransferase n=1 Tax=Halorubrum lacusprofundi (strain ATCC 49239 / DSM 5036 / JCM 8891 / ACAM 34) TaxID=416348 RepID=B9LN25_HALLT|nr:aminoglycoside phosphotransferase family protein [Halorubrum lacusprofundi]ACM56763.1 aminoglycoside phosphotransferase [Halorubrum lacusprofundi ATCC 49239]MCG1007756.1 aminoglycoside phosphotransferase family protein [Halorubrum lacusprofundi]